MALLGRKLNDESIIFFGYIFNGGPILDLYTLIFEYPPKTCDDGLTLPREDTFLGSGQGDLRTKVS